MKKFLISILLFTAATNITFSQNPSRLGEKMDDFTLASYQGIEVTLSELVGKNVLLIFPRGRVGDHWCQICHYQYATLAELESELNIREKYNLEILFVLPYSEEEVDEWVSIFPHQMEVIDGWKNPPESQKENARVMNWANRANREFPKNFVIEENNIPTPFPILIDSERSVSKNLKLFTVNWDNSYVEQNIPGVYIIDDEGKVKFKYTSQNTFDRPSNDYLMNFLEKIVLN